MKNKEDMFLVGLIVVIIVLVVALFMTPVKVEVIGAETDASASITIGNPPQEALPQQTEEIVEEVVEEPVEEELKEEVEPAPEPEPEIVVIQLKDSRFTPDYLSVKSGTVVMWESNEKYDARQIDVVSYGKHTYSPKLMPGESWSMTLTGPAIYHYNAVGYESRKGRIKVEG